MAIVSHSASEAKDVTAAAKVLAQLDEMNQKEQQVLERLTLDDLKNELRNRLLVMRNAGKLSDGWLRSNPPPTRKTSH